jgi:murein DD-endopeptidase MepM/ murein hydrolase activator NlpD
MSPNDRFSLVYSDVPRDRERASGHVYYASVQSGGETLSCYVLKPGRDEDFTCMTEKDTVTQRLGPTGYVTPVDGVLRSAFGPRMHPLLGQVRMHQGVDWAAPPGTPVKAAFDGTVLFAGENGGYGNFVRILHPAGLETGYAHLSGFATNLRKGAQVKAKDIIGYVGSSGLSTGPHLHFELYADGQPVDPFSVEVAAVAQSAGATEKEKVVGRIIRVESGGNPIAKNPLSSATGLGQFLSGTWLRMIRSYRPDLYQQMNDADLLALRTDPSLAREMVFNLAAENEADIKRAGFQATAGNLYLAHFLGSQGAIDVLSVPPETPLVDVVGSSVISANPFLHGRDSAWVIDWAARKMTGRGVSMTTVKRLPPEIRIKNSRFRAYSAAIDKLLESIESSKPKS